MRKLTIPLFITLLALPLHLGAAETPETAPVPAPLPVISAAPAFTDAASAAKRLKLGYADLAKIAEEADAAKVARTHFESKADRFKSQIDTKQKMLEKQKATLEAKISTYTPEQRVAKIKDYEKKVDELRKLLQKADAEMKPMQEELMKEVYGKIESAAKAYGAANGYAAIVDKRQLLFLGTNIDAEDVTDSVIKEMNQPVSAKQ